MWTSNVDKQDNLMNGQTGSIKHIEFFDGNVQKVCVKFSDEQSDSKAMKSTYLGRQIVWFLLKNLKLRF